MIDLKTLYEQTTMYCEFVMHHDFTDGIYSEEFVQPETPIHIYVYWNREKSKIVSIEYFIKGEF